MRIAGRWFLLIALTAAWLIVAGEALHRFQGGWRFDSLPLESRPKNFASRTLPEKYERALVNSLTSRSDANPDWFFLPATPISKPSNPELVQRTKENPAASGLENFVWNSDILDLADPSVVTAIRSMNVERIFVFRSYNHSIYPRFRLFPDNDFRPTAWITNHWGWISPEVSFPKPPRVIRIGIIGDSTSHNMYAFSLQTYLNKWAQARHFDIRFEVMNAARQGLGRDDGIAALQFELAPMGLDFVYVYYAPSFSLSISQMAAWATLPPGVKAGVPPIYSTEKFSTISRKLDRLAKYSALVRRAKELAAHEAQDSVLPEPAKPRATLHVDPATDPYFKNLRRQLDAVKKIADANEIKVVVSRERLCAWNEMVLTQGSNAHLYQVLNGPLFWPFTYAQLRGMLDMHNATIETWARDNGAIIVDIDGKLPRQPTLYSDAHHDIPLGQRLRAWLIFQALAPELEQGILSGRLPRSNGATSSTHPYLEQAIETVERKEYLRLIDSNLTHPGRTK